MVVISTKPASLLWLFVLTLVKDSWGVADIKKLYADHAECNGAGTVFPSAYLTGGVLAASQCLGYLDDYCQFQCIAVGIPNVVGKDGKLNMGKLREDARKVNRSPKNTQAVEDIMNAMERCGNTFMPKWERPAFMGACPQMKKHMECVDEEYAYACKGKPRPVKEVGPGLVVSTIKPPVNETGQIIAVSTIKPSVNETGPGLVVSTIKPT